MDETLWHKCSVPLWPRRTVEGKWLALTGQCWRRKVDGRWEYQQDPETADEYDARQY